jgi:hypothetical protein
MELCDDARVKYLVRLGERSNVTVVGMPMRWLQTLSRTRSAIDIRRGDYRAHVFYRSLVCAGLSTERCFDRRAKMTLSMTQRTGAAYIKALSSLSLAHRYASAASYKARMPKSHFVTLRAYSHDSDLGEGAACHRFVFKCLGHRLLRRCVLVAAVMSIFSAPNVVFASAAYQTASSVHDDRDEKLAFDIPPQLLLSALRAYSEITGQAVLVDDSMTVGLRSPGVQGEFNKVDALQRVLMGTGLTASYSSEQAFTLKVIDARRHFDTDAQPDRDNVADKGEKAIERYAAKIQWPIEQALCRIADNQAIDDHVALQIWLTPTGRVEKTRLLSASTHQREVQILQAVNHLVLEPPPPAMPEPLTLLFFPGKAIAADRCTSHNLSAR